MFTLIETEEDLSILNQEFLSKPYLAVDTEFRRTTKDNNFDDLVHFEIKE